MKKLATFIIAVLLSGCQQAPNAYTPAPFAFEINHIAPLMVNVHEIRVVDEYQPRLSKPNVEHEFPVAPAIAVKKWVNQRLQPNPAISANSVLEVVITDASVKETPLPKTKGVKGVFTDDQDARYDARIAVTFRTYMGAQAMSSTSGDVIVTRSRSINERATVYEREAIYHNMLREMMATFDSEAQLRLRQYFQPFLQ
jgi:hypothetical protein